MGNSKKYNGYPSYNAWNIALWISNDERLYALAKECKEDSDTQTIAARNFMNLVGTKHTPDGVPWTHTNVQLALREIEVDNGPLRL